MNKQELASKIWASANKMRSKIEASEYKDYILGFMFYKFLSEKEEIFLCQNEFSKEDILESVNEENPEIVNFVASEIGYFISYENLFSTWVNLGSDFSVDNVSTALSAFDRLINNNFKNVFDGVFTTLQTGLSKLGDTSGARTKAILGLIELINDIPMDGKQGYDVLGFVYEYLISMFAANAGKKAGEFYTPHEVSILMSEIIAEYHKNKENIKIYDPTSGSGSLLINIGDSVAKRINDRQGVKYYAQELKENTYNLTRMNLVMRGINPNNIYVRNADTLEEDWPYFDESDPTGTYEPLYVDAVVSNPPYSQAWDPSDKENDPRYSQYGLAPKTKADYAFLLHDLYHVNPDGLMCIVLPHGVLFRGGEEGQIRKNLIEKNKIDAIIGLPPNIFFGTGIPTIVMVLKHRRDDNDILIIDASKGFVKDGKNNRLRARDIKKITDCVNSRASIDRFAKLVSIEEIRQNEYNLNIPRYVEPSDNTESYDLFGTLEGKIPNSEIDLFDKYWQIMPGLKEDLFVSDDEKYSLFNDIDIHSTVDRYIKQCNVKTKLADKLEPVIEYLNRKIVKNWKSIDIQSEKETISDMLRNCIPSDEIYDFYDFYQILDNKWNDISIDLEILQTEGIDAARVVDPLMVIKKKSGKDVEVQEGWKGRILPLELVEKVYFKDKSENLVSLNSELEDSISSLQEIIENLGDEDKDKLLNDNNDSFIAKSLNDEIKEIKNSFDIKSLDEETREGQIFKAYKLIQDQKRIKKLIKEETLTLEQLNIKQINKLSDSEVYEMLNCKWVDDFKERMISTLDNMASQFVSSLVSLKDKYGDTLRSIDNEIFDTEVELKKMLSNLTGSEHDMKAIDELASLLGNS